MFGVVGVLGAVVAASMGVETKEQSLEALSP
jgi:hypothetical protein